MVDLRQAPHYAAYMKSLGWQVLKCQISGVESWMFIKNVPLVGTIVKLQRPQGQLNYKEIKRLIDFYKIRVFYIEPLEEQKNIPPIFSFAKSSFVPSKTIHIDLTKPENLLLKAMGTKTRYNIKVAQRNKVLVEKSQDIDQFANLWQKTALKRRMFIPQKREIKEIWKAFGKNANLLLAFHTSTREKPLAGILMVCSPDTAFYLYAFSTNLGKKLFAPTWLAWEAIKLAKKKGGKTFDFEGIYDERYPKQTKTWKGFTKFKEGFGGKIVEFPKTLAYFSNPLLKFL